MTAIYSSDRYTTSSSPALGGISVPRFARYPTESDCGRFQDWSGRIRKNRSEYLGIPPSSNGCIKLLARISAGRRLDCYSLPWASTCITSLVTRQSKHPSRSLCCGWSTNASITAGSVAAPQICSYVCYTSARLWSSKYEETFRPRRGTGSATSATPLWSSGFTRRKS